MVLDKVNTYVGDLTRLRADVGMVFLSKVLALSACASPLRTRR